jgi:hypothetical protein
MREGGRRGRGEGGREDEERGERESYVYECGVMRGCVCGAAISLKGDSRGGDMAPNCRPIILIISQG